MKTVDIGATLKKVPKAHDFSKAERDFLALTLDDYVGSFLQSLNEMESGVDLVGDSNFSIFGKSGELPLSLLQKIKDHKIRVESIGEDEGQWWDMNRSLRLNFADDSRPSIEFDQFRGLEGLL